MVFGGAFFLLLAVAALTSAISLLEALTAWGAEYGKKRSTSAILLSIILAALAVVAAYSYEGGLLNGFKPAGMSLFDWLDTLTGSYLPPICALLTIIFFGWFMKKEEIHDGSRFYLYRTEFTFHVDIRSSQTCLITNQNAETLMLDQCGEEPDAPPAVIITGDETISVYENGYSGENFRIERSFLRNRTVYYIIFSVPADIEGEAIPAGERTELFSGCHFRVNGKEYTFLIR